MQRTTVFLMLLFGVALTGCQGDENLNRFCDNPQPCYIEEGGGVVTVANPRDFRAFNVIGSNCSLGYTDCDPESGDIVCLEYKPPGIVGELETCDDNDNDCDFEKDEDLTRSPVSEENTCTNNAAGCLQVQNCVGGGWDCSLINPEACTEEVCDGEDNDGDGLTDEEDPDLYPNGPQFYWPEDIYPSEEISFASNSGCSAGRVRCIDGEVFYEGLSYPNLEQCGDFVDNDCDGSVDETDNPDHKGAFVFVLDVSGSMDGYLAAATDSACNFSQNNILSNSVFAVIFVGFADGAAERQIIFGTDFVDSASVCAYLTAQPWMQHQGGQEFQPEGIVAAHQQRARVTIAGNIDLTPQGMPYQYELNWPEDLDKKIAVFTDEFQQTSPLFFMEELFDDCIDNEYAVGVFTPNNFHYQWYPITSHCGGFVGTLHTSSYFMEQEMVQFLTGGC